MMSWLTRPITFQNRRSSQSFMIGIPVMKYCQEHQTLSTSLLKERRQKEYGLTQSVFGLQNTNLKLRNCWGNALRRIGVVAKSLSSWRNQKNWNKLRRCCGKTINPSKKPINSMLVTIPVEMYFQCPKTLHLISLINVNW